MNATVPTIDDLRERFARGLSPELVEEGPRLLTARIHAHGEERVPLFMLANVCRFLSSPLREHGDDATRLANANERLAPAVGAVLAGIADEAPPAEMYQLLDRLVSASAGANRALTMGESAAAGHP
jgi:hypothetical protein